MFSFSFSSGTRLSNRTCVLWSFFACQEFVSLDMGKTLEENGVRDESEEFERLGIEDAYDEDLCVPVLHVYFNDDLTVS